MYQYHHINSQPDFAWLVNGQASAAKRTPLPPQNKWPYWGLMKHMKALFLQFSCKHATEKHVKSGAYSTQGSLFLISSRSSSHNGSLFFFHFELRMEVCPPHKFEHIFWEDQQLRELVQEVFPQCLTMHPGPSIWKKPTKTKQSKRRLAKWILVGEKFRPPHTKCTGWIFCHPEKCLKVSPVCFRGLLRWSL